MLAAYDVLSRIFGQRAVVNAYYRTDPNSMVVRDEDDEFFKYVKFFGYDDPKEDWKSLEMPRNNPRIINEESRIFVSAFCFLALMYYK